MNLKDYLIEVLQLNNTDTSVKLIDQEPAFRFSLEKRGENDE
ncbi:hypothetical protein [Bacillus sp. Marseille-P3661]|nr:hypothetical protein [Bacillus sp. Marseille-P3661]